MLKSINNTIVCATAITVALVLTAPVAFMTGAFAAPKENKECKDIQFQTLESDRSITIETSLDEYIVEVDYYEDTGGFATHPYFKNIAAEEPSDGVLVTAGETLIVTLQTVEEISSFGTYVTLYSDKVSDCDILLGHTKVKDKVDFEIADAQQIDESGTWQLTVRVPDLTTIGKDFTKLAVQFPSTPESTEYYLISDSVQII